MLEPVSDEVITRLKADNPRTDLARLDVEVDGVAGAAIVAIPSTAKYQRFMEIATKDEDTLGAYRTLLLDCAIHPTREGMVQVLERQPALAVQMGKQLVALAGAAAKVTAKKL